MLLVLALAAALETPDPVVAARAAIIDAVRQRLGATVDVVVTDLVVSGAPRTTLRAVPEPGARLGAAMRFTLQAAGGGSAIGSASARVAAFLPHVHAVQPIERGVNITADDVAAVTHLVAEGPLRAWPGAAAAIGGRALRPLAAGACLSHLAIAPARAVRTGQDVTAVAAIDGVEARAVMVAAGSGDAGDVIRVVNRQSRRALKARVVAPGIVEILK